MPLSHYRLLGLDVLSLILNFTIRRHPPTRPQAARQGTERRILSEIKIGQEGHSGGLSMISIQLGRIGGGSSFLSHIESRKRKILNITIRNHVDSESAMIYVNQSFWAWRHLSPPENRTWLEVFSFRNQAADTIRLQPIRQVLSLPYSVKVKSSLG